MLAQGGKLEPPGEWIRHPLPGAAVNDPGNKAAVRSTVAETRATVAAAITAPFAWEEAPCPPEG